MIAKLCKPPLSWRVALIGASVVFLVLGVEGVSGCQRIGVERAGVHVPSGWYWLAVVPPVFVTALALFLPSRLLCDPRSLLTTVLFFFVVLAGSAGPLLYIIYDFERRFAQREASRTSTP